MADGFGSAFAQEVETGGGGLLESLVSQVVTKVVAQLKPPIVNMEAARAPNVMVSPIPAPDVKVNVQPPEVKVDVSPPEVHVDAAQVAISPTIVFAPKSSRMVVTRNMDKYITEVVTTYEY